MFFPRTKRCHHLRRALYWVGPTPCRKNMVLQIGSVSTNSRRCDRKQSCRCRTCCNITMLKSGSTALLLAGATVSGQALLYTLRSHTARTLQQKHGSFAISKSLFQCLRLQKWENHREYAGGGTRGANSWAMYGIFALIGAKATVVAFSHAEAVL